MHALALRRLSPVVALALCAPAFGQWDDDFEAYANLSPIEGQGGWHNWDSINTGNQTYNYVTEAVGAIVPTSGTKMLRIAGGNDVNCSLCSDTVHELQGPYTSGQWTLRMMQYVPTSFAGTTYIIGLNTYSDGGGPYNWSIQVSFDANNALVTAEGSYSGGATPVINFGAWTEFRAEIDLDNDMVELFYDNISLGMATWSAGVSTTGGVVELGTLDLFPLTDDTTEVYYDDIVLEPNGGAIQVVCDPANMHTQGNYTKLDNSTLGAPTGILSGLHLEASDGPAGEFGYFLVSAGAGSSFAVSNGILCLDGPQGRYAPASGISALNSIGSFDAAGNYQSLVQTQQGWDVPTGLPTPPGGAIAAGDTWYFQMWYRDGQRSNFSNAICVTF